MSFEISLDALREAGCVLLGEPAPGSGISFAYLVALGPDGEPRAFRNECMHIAIPLGIFPDAIHVEGSLLCATHGARYRIDDGYCFEGPCIGTTLEHVPFEVVDGMLRLRPEPSE